MGVTPVISQLGEVFGNDFINTIKQKRNEFKNVITVESIIPRDLLKDSQWSTIDGEPCRVIDFIPMASIKEGKISAIDKKTPYASVVLESKKLPTETRGFIMHKVDFMHLWLAFKERGVKQDEEVLIFWTKKHYKGVYKIVSAFLPRLWVMICKKDASELMTDPDSRPELQGKARFLAQRPIIDWKPEVME